MYPTSTQIQAIQAAYRQACESRGHTVADVILNNSIPGSNSAELLTTDWLATAAALAAANGNLCHVIYALTAENLPF